MNGVGRRGGDALVNRTGAGGGGAPCNTSEAVAPLKT